MDHANPIYRGSTDKELERMNVVRGLDEESNLVPSCKRCNLWKSTYTLENFRIEIGKQPAKLLKNSNYKMALDFGLVVESDIEVKFWFEYYD